MCVKGREKPPGYEGQTSGWCPAQAGGLGSSTDATKHEDEGAGPMCRRQGVDVWWSWALVSKLDCGRFEGCADRGAGTRASVAHRAV